MTRVNLDPTTPDLIAPCGIDCRLCHGFTREKKPCPGCRGEDAMKPTSCINCIMKACDRRPAGSPDFCFTCDGFPCPRLKQLDKRYRGKYGVSPIANLKIIRQNGLAQFVAAENRKWICPSCGALLCMHKPTCLSCGYPWLATWSIS